MLVSRSIASRWPHPLSQLAHRCHFQSLNKPTRPPRQSSQTKKPSKSPPKDEHPQSQLSLYEELFPEEALKNKTPNNATPQADTLPRLPPYQPETSPIQTPTNTVPITRYDYQKDPLQNHNTTILIISGLSRSLTTTDFRRIAPKGAHIPDWNGPGDILKVIPARNPQTLAQLPYFFLLFPRDTHAVIYRDHVTRLHRLSQTYTPTSIESPFLFHPGRRWAQHQDELADDGAISQRESQKNEMEREYDALKEYALLPPSQTFYAQLKKAPFRGMLRHVVENWGYAIITRGRKGEDRTGRCVMFWIEGTRQPGEGMVEGLLRTDGRERGLYWECEVERFWEREDEGVDEAGIGGGQELGSKEREAELRNDKMRRWILTFRGQEDARRFVRGWHKRAISLGRRMEDGIVNVELLW